MNLLAQMTWTQWLLALLLVFVCVVLMIVILLQRGRGGGLAGAFGGAGGTAAFGAKTGDVFTWITVVVAAVFVLLAVVANFAFDQSAAPTPAPQMPAEGPDTSGMVPPATGGAPASPAGSGAEGNKPQPGGPAPANDTGTPEPSDVKPEAPGTTPG